MSRQPDGFRPGGWLRKGYRAEVVCRLRGILLGMRLRAV
jgi:hypothetical protein